MLRNAEARAEVWMVTGSSSKIEEKVSLFSMRLKRVMRGVYTIREVKYHLWVVNLFCLCAARKFCVNRKARKDAIPRLDCRGSE